MNAICGSELQPSLRDSGGIGHGSPTLKRWAIAGHPSGMQMQANGLPHLGSFPTLKRWAIAHHPSGIRPRGPKDVGNAQLRGERVPFRAGKGSREQSSPRLPAPPVPQAGGPRAQANHGEGTAPIRRDYGVYPMGSAPHGIHTGVSRVSQRSHTGKSGCGNRDREPPLSQKWTQHQFIMGRLVNPGIWDWVSGLR